MDPLYDFFLKIAHAVRGFANGEPAESFAHCRGSFSFDQMSGESSLQTLPPRENQVAQAVA